MTRPNLLVVTEPASRCGCHKVEHERDALAAHIEQAHRLYLQLASVEMVIDPELKRMVHQVEPVLMAEWEQWYRTAPAESLQVHKQRILAETHNRVLDYVDGRQIRGHIVDGVELIAPATVAELLGEVLDLIMEGE